MEELLAKYFSEEVNDDERSLVETWRSSSKENAEAFLDAKINWLATEEIPSERPDILASIIEPEPLKSFILQNSWAKYAAAAVLVIAIGALFVLNNFSATSSFDSRTFDDGSEIALHGTSEVEVVNFDESVREIKLSGKAYFDIARDEKRPFIIHTENATIKVLGTSFLIDTSIEGTEVCVESGLVELIKDDEAISVELGKGKMGMVLNKNKGIIKKDNENLNYLSWKTKILTFKNNEMTEVKKVIEEVYGIEVKFENEDFSNCKLTAKFNKKKPKDAIEIIARTFNMEFDFDGNVAILKGNGC